MFDFPLEPFPITKRHSVHPELGEHFDAVIGGIELVSGDTELNDPVDQWQRFVDQRKRRAIDDGDVPHPNDEEYARAIEYGYSPTAGGGMGVDRLVMILTERDTLREVIPFPIVAGHLMSASKLDLDPGVVAACRAGRRADRRAGRRADRRHARPSRSSAASRACSASTAPTSSRYRCRTCSWTTSQDARRARPRDRLLAGQRDDRRPGRSPQQIAEAVSAGELDLCDAAERAEERRDPRARDRGVRRAPGRDQPHASRSAARCASAWAKRRTPLRYVLTATGDVYEDVVHAKAVAEAGGDIVAVIRSTAQSLLDYVPYGPDDGGLRRHVRHAGELPHHARGDGRVVRAARPLRPPVELLLGPVHVGDRGDGRVWRASTTWSTTPSTGSSTATSTSCAA